MSLSRCEMMPKLTSAETLRARLAPRRMLLWAFLLAVLQLFATGCNRQYYRLQADRDAYGLIYQKMNHPHWDLGKFNIYMDPRSRMAAVDNLDCPQMPPDDPAAHDLMHCVDGKRGFPDWHCAGDTPYVENPLWLQFINLDERGKLVMTADDAIRLGLIHSREYQGELEQLYLSALDVSFERFRFDAQFFAGGQTSYTADGPDRPGSGGNSQSILNLQTFSSGQRPWAVQKAFTSGATLVVGLANQLVWQFSGPNDYRGTTLLDFALVQPVLRNAGRDRVMERLTVSERVLLTNVRAMEQYRQEFYVSLMTGRQQGQGPQRRGGVFGSGLEGFTGTAGGFGRVGGATGGVNNTASGGAGAGAGQVGGYLGLLQTQQGIRNLEDNVTRLRSNLFRLDQFLVELKSRSSEEGLVNNILRQDLQVAQARQALFNAESQLINTRNSYEATVDNFKVTLGLPPELCVEVSDTIIKPFQLVDVDAQEEANRLNAINDEFGQARLRITKHFRTERRPDPNNAEAIIDVRLLKWYPELPQDLEVLRKLLEEVREIRGRLIATYLPAAESDLEKSRISRQNRRKRLAELKQKIEEIKDDPCTLLPVPGINQEIFDLDTRDELFEDLASNLGEVSQKVDQAYLKHLDEREGLIDAAIDRGETLTEDQLGQLVYERILFPKPQEDRGAAPGVPVEDLDTPQVRDIVVEFPSDLLVVQLVQAVARAESIELKPVGLEIDRALAISRKYRRDLMNARTSLIDAWRLIRFNADQLESTVNIFFNGDISNFGDNPLDLRSSTGRLRAGLQFDAPLTRLSERNTYRQSLIEYQQARRTFYAFEDQVFRVLRSELRSLFTNELNFELQRLAVLQAARQVDRNEDIRIDQELTNQASGATAARDSVSALTDLLNAQNNFLSIWVNYEATRQSLDLDMGTMQLTAEGLWIDPGEIGKNYASEDPWCKEVFAGDPEDPAFLKEQLPGVEKAPRPQLMPRMNADGSVDMPPEFMPMQPDNLPQPPQPMLPEVPRPMNGPQLPPAPEPPPTLEPAEPALFAPPRNQTRNLPQPTVRLHPVGYARPGQ